MRKLRRAHGAVCGWLARWPMAQTQKVVSTNRSLPFCCSMDSNTALATSPSYHKARTRRPGKNIFRNTRAYTTKLKALKLCISFIAFNMSRKRTYFHQIMALVSAHRIIGIASVRCVYTYQYIARVIWPYKCISSTLIKDMKVFSHFEFPAEHLGRSLN